MSAVKALHAFEKLAASAEKSLEVHLGGESVHEVLSQERDRVLDPAWPELARALPDHGFPRGVTEIAAPHAHGGGTTIALAAIRAAQAQGIHVHCAWIEAEDGPHLYAPEVLVAGVDPSRLLVVRAPREALGRVAVKALASSAFAQVVVAHGAHVQGESRERTLSERAVRRMALAGEECGARVIILTDSYFSHVPWPVALRLETTRLPETIHVRVARERRGRIGQAKSIPIRTRPLGPPSHAPKLARTRGLEALPACAVASRAVAPSSLSAHGRASF